MTSSKDSQPKIKVTEEKDLKVGSPNPETSLGCVDKTSTPSSPTNSDESLDYTLWDYIPDPSISINSPRHYSKQHSQPMFCLRGKSYTPPGWQRKYYKKEQHKNDPEAEPKDTTEQPPAVKKLKFQ